ncbi:MAG: hypothetical protein V7K32_11610 [Nostoc sp.]|uniref:hypothetical protein n=1 Tax=Nostoc sp. TaxID=1180 RepID=UPI002FF7351A
MLLPLPQQLYLLQVANKQGHIVIFIMAKSLCQELPEKTDKTRGNTSIGSFEVKHQILVESQLLKYKWLLVSVIVPKDTTGEPACLIGLAVDSTSCVQVELLFPESEKRFRPIFNSSFQFIGLLITEGIVLEVKQTALHLGELQPQDVVEHPCWEINMVGATCQPRTSAIFTLLQPSSNLHL